ncbi:MAG TPA: hypothetical protein VGR96_15705 [Acidobacteriaceae bacterium]|nr:hypothetical protein [Acidobacteriaceae bacterium]
MTTPGFAVSLNSLIAAPVQKSMEHTPSDPMEGAADEPQNSAGLSEEDQSRLIALVRRYKDQWSQDRMVLMQRCLLNLEFFKGNQFIAFGPGSAEFFDAAGWMNENGQREHAEDSDDKDLYQYCNNFYQMLATGFVAVLAPQVPKSRWLPENAEHLTDVTTAKAAQTLIDIVERQNREQSMLKQQLLYLYTTGAVFRHTRYVVDADRAGTRKEPVFNETVTEILPDRYHCFACGADTPAEPRAEDETEAEAASARGTRAWDAVLGGAAVSHPCAHCGRALGEASFFPAEYGPAIQKVGEQEVPNGMVAQNVYCPLEVDCDPAAQNLRQTPILNLEVEVHLGALRAAYPEMYDQITASGGGLSANGDIDRLARQQVYSQTGAYLGISDDQRPTLSRTWIQPWAFDLEDDREFGERMREAYPGGILLVNVGDTFLSAQEAVLTKEWTWAGTHEGFGLYPPSIGDIVVPFQKRYNDMANILHEFMDRCSSGVTLANADLIDTKAMQGKPLLPGVLNLVKLKRTGAPGSTRLADALFQFQFEMHEEAFSYLNTLTANAQMFAGVPPQVYGGGGDPHVETFGGQQQQLNTALGKLNIYWDNLREEHAAADELAVRCAKENMTEDLRQVILEKGSEFRNNYVRLDDLGGNVHAYPDTDQGFPITAAELRQRWMDLMQAAAQNPIARTIFEDPTNQEQAATALGVPGMVVPGAAMRAKVLQNIDELLQSQAIPVLDARTSRPTGQPRPSILPDKEIDDFTVLKQVVRQYCQENSDLPDRNPAGWQNILAYLTAAVAMETQQSLEHAARQSLVNQAGSPKAPAVPADEVNDVVNTIGSLMHLPPESTKGSIAGQVEAANTLIKLAGTG